jgi:hypothetical protein
VADALVPDSYVWAVGHDRCPDYWFLAVPARDGVGDTVHIRA